MSSKVVQKYRSRVYVCKPCDLKVETFNDLTIPKCCKKPMVLQSDSSVVVHKKITAHALPKA